MKLQAEIHRGLDAKQLHRSNSVVGFHGTSIESFERFITDGYLPAGIVAEGHLYFLPIKKMPFKEFGRNQSTSEILETLSSARIYAGINAVGSGTLRRLGLKSYTLETRRDVDEMIFLVERIQNDGERLNINMSVRNDIIRRLYLEENITLSRINQVVKRTQHRKGIVFGLSERIKKDFPMSTGDGGEPDLKFFVGKGLSFEYVNGVQVLGEFEKRVLERHFKRAGLTPHISIAPRGRSL